MKEITFYFDFLSPFSFFAYQKLLAQENFVIHFSPVALGPILNHWSIKGPGEVTPKREFLLKQCLRYAAKNNLAFTTPKVHPFNSLYALRLALKSTAGELQSEVIRALWQAGWQQRIDMGDPEELKLALEKNHLPAHELFEKSFSSEARAELKSNIHRAISQGVFGVPSFIAGDELFWGNDSMDSLMDYLDGGDPLDREKLQDLLSSTPRGANQSL
jgi:2-hydroxychromene-2-carboxylate isomerase